MSREISIIIEQFVDMLMPELTPFEAMLYIFLLRHSGEDLKIRIGKRTIAEKLGKGARSKKTSYKNISNQLKGLEEKGCIKVGEISREGTSYIVVLPKYIPLVAEKLAIIEQPEEEDFFNDLEKRKELFKRDKWTCYYCGEKVSPQNAVLDHLIPQSKGGKNTKDNLKTSCFICNSIKSGKTYEEAAPYLLKNIKERKNRSRDNN